MRGSAAERIRDRVTVASRAGLTLEDYVPTVLDILRAAVPFESACLATTDPDTGLLTGSTKVDLPDARDPDFARHEYEIEDLNTFVEIGRRTDPVGVLALDTDGHPERSTRYREFLVPYFDQGNELRLAFRTQGRVWGLLGLYRPTRGTGFSIVEADYLARMSSIVGEGLRAALVASTAATHSGPDGPAVLVLDAHNEVVGASGPAQERVEQLGGRLWSGLPLPVVSIASAARVAARHGGPTPRLRLRSPQGRWVVVHASALAARTGHSGEVIVTLDDARPPDVVPVLVAAYGLTERERDVVVLVLRGSSTHEIATMLSLSPYTVQDHLKAVFAKVGVRSRRELVAAVFAGHYAPRMGASLGPDGFFA
jgi:DNA-binding CsgD family transcriptional regulator